MSERETLTSALAGPLVNARATSAGVAPWAPIPGSSSGACGSSRLASPTSRGWVAPTTAPTLDRPQSPTSSSPQEATSSATWCQSGRPSESFRSWMSPAGVGGLDHAEDPRARRGGSAREERLERLASQIRVDSEGVPDRAVAVPRARGTPRRRHGRSSRCRRASRRRGSRAPPSGRTRRHPRRTSSRASRAPRRTRSAA